MTLLLFLDRQEALNDDLMAALGKLAEEPVPVEPRVVLTRSYRVAPEIRGVPVVTDVEGLATTRYGVEVGNCYLIRPDQHVTARWRQFEPEAVRAAARRALAAVQVSNMVAVK